MKLFTKERPLTPSWELVRPSFNIFRENFTEVVYLYLLPAVALSLGLLLSSSYDFTGTPTNRENLGLLITLFALFWRIMTAPGFIYMQVEASKGRPINASEAFKKALPRLPSLLGAAFILVAAVMVAVVALGVVMGIILTAAGAAQDTTVVGIVSVLVLLLFLFGFRYFALTPYFIVDQNAGAYEGLRKSYDETKGVSAWIWGTIGVYTAFVIPAVIIGYRLPGIGDIITTLIVLPYSFAFALRYIEITKKPKSSKKAKQLGGKKQAGHRRKT